MSHSKAIVASTSRIVALITLFVSASAVAQSGVVVVWGDDFFDQLSIEQPNEGYVSVARPGQRG